MKPSYRVAALVAVLLIHGLLLWMAHQPEPRALWGDEEVYLDAARALQAGESVDLDPLWPPLYPRFLALLLSLGGGSLLVIQLVQTALLVGSAFLFRDLWRRLVGPGPLGEALAFSLVLYPPLVAFAHYLWPEVLHLALFSAVLWLLVAGRRSWLGLAALGLTLGLALQTKYLLGPFVPVLLLPIVLGAEALRIRMLRLMTVLAVVLVTLAPSLVHSFRTTGAFPMATSARFNLWVGLNDRARTNFGPDEIVGREYQAYRASSDDPRERLRILDEKIDDYLAEHGLLSVIADQLGRQYFRLFDKDSFLTDQLPGGAIAVRGYGYRGTPAWMATLVLLSSYTTYGVLLLGAVLGLVCVPPAHRRWLWLPLSFVGYLLLVFLFVHVKTRYRITLLPFLMVYGWLFLASAETIAGRLRRPGRGLLAVAGCAVMALLAFGGPLLGYSYRAVVDVPLGATRYLTDDLRLELIAGTDPGNTTLSAGRVVLGRGWSIREPWGTWATGLQSTVAVHVPDDRARILRLECRPHLDVAERPQQIAVSLDGSSIGTLDLDTGWQQVELSIPSGLLRSGVHLLTFDYAYAESPASIGGGNDPREIAVGFRTISLPAVDEPPSSPPLEVSSGILGRPGRVILPIAKSGSDATVQVALLDPWTDESLPRFAWYRMDGDEPSPAPASVVSGDWRVKLDDTGIVDVPGCLGIEVTDRVAASAPRLSRVMAKNTVVARRPRRAGRAPRPDVIVLLLDAARPQHFGAYGYSRPTTPRIDRFAEESLVFRNAYATAPYTLSSIPTILTGLSFVDHGVLRPGQSLAPEARTLPEYLAALGYRTLCFSANPNYSVAHGSDQGCDLFEEVWRGVDQATAIDPFHMTRVVTDRLAEADDGRPLLMFVHYVPPHEPYAPGAEYDRFGDPDYRGTYDGTIETIAAIDRGERTPSTEDLERVISLYDGNLLRGDAAVGQLLEVLESRDRWDETLVLLISDHGEAFGEHGRMGHNSTVYDEMLRVPFILRLPGGARPAHVDTDGLVSLEDVVPTVLGQVGLEPALAVNGLDLLSQDSRAGRALVARSAGEPADYAYWTRRWKAIARGSETGRWELYDRIADPAERRDRAVELLEHTLCLSGLLQQFIAAPYPGRQQDETVMPDDEALKTLRSLGYVQ